MATLQGWLKADPNQQRGEFVVVIEGASAVDQDDAEIDRILKLLLAELPVKSAARMAASITGTAKNELYQRALALRAAGQGTTLPA